MKLATHVRRVLMVALLVLSTLAAISVPRADAHSECMTVPQCHAALAWQKHRYAHEHLLRVRVIRRDASYALRLAAAMSGEPLPNLRCIGWHESRMGAQTSAEPGSGAKGLMQFLDSTWRSTRFYAFGFSVWDNVANALAAVQIMVHDGSARQWTTGRGCGL